ncbi:MAG: BTAD domain-containing putative transcriptional regulator [Solirubrobacteraceae bacterium]
MDGSITVRLIGGLVLERAGERLPPPGPAGGHAELVVARLAIDAGQTVPQLALAEAIWDEPPRSWKSALRNVIAALRRWLAREGARLAVVVVTVGDGYRLVLPPGSVVDVSVLGTAVREAERLHREGEPAAALAQAERARAAAEPEVLPGAYGEWVEQLRGRLDDMRLRLERVIGAAALATGDAPRAEQAARRLVSAEPLREEGHRLLMLALRNAGNGAEALVAYDRCRRTLAEALGAMPSPATESLFLEILADERADGAPLTGGGQRTPVAGSLLRARRPSAFVGRTGILERLTARLRAAVAAGPVLVTVTGEAGLGKTSLAAELGARARADGVAVLYGQANDRIDVPYGALLEALEGGLASVPAAEVIRGLGEHAQLMGRLLPSLFSAGEVPEPHGLGELDRWRIGQAIIAALRLLTAGHGALLVLDDMHWASRLDLDVVAAIAREERLALLLLLLERAEPDAGPRGDGSLGGSRRPGQETMALEPLGAAELAELARAGGVRDDAEYPGAVGASVLQMTGGNPLLASELIRSWPDGRAADRPVRIDVLVRERLAVLTPRSEEILRAAAVAGVEFDPRVVADACEVTQREVDLALAQARRAGLLVAATRSPRWLAFRHALVRTALLDRLEAPVRSRLHQRLGAALESDAERDRSAFVSAAHHFGAATAMGEWRRAVRYGLPVARAAFAAGIYEDVGTVARRALRALAEADDPDPGVRLDLEILLGGAQRALGEPAGYPALLRAFADARERGDAVRMADAALAFTFAGAASEEAYIDDGLRAVYEQALGALGDADPRRRALLLGHLASALAWRRSGAAGVRAADEALALAHRDRDRATRARVLTTTRRSLTGLGMLDRQELMEDELSALADHFDDPGLRVRTALWRFETMVARGNGDGLESQMTTAAIHVAELRGGNYHHSVAYGTASLALLRGELDDADRLVARAAEIGLARGLDPVVVQGIQLIQLVWLRYEQHRLGDLRDQLNEFAAVSAIPSWFAVGAFIEAALGGEPRDVAEQIDQLLAIQGDRGPTMVVPIGLMAQTATAVAGLDEPARAKRVYEAIAGYSGQGGYVAAFAGPIDYHLGLLARSLGRPHDARSHLQAAVTFSDRLGAPRWSERCRAALGDLPTAAPAASGPP